MQTACGKEGIKTARKGDKKRTHRTSRAELRKGSCVSRRGRGQAWPRKNHQQHPEDNF